MNVFIHITPKTKAADMFNSQTQKSECKGAFYPDLADFIKAHQDDADNCSPVETFPLTIEAEQMDARAGHGTIQDSLNSSLGGMPVATNGSLSFYEELKFFAKIRLLSVVASITTITAVLGIIVAG